MLAEEMMTCEMPDFFITFHIAAQACMMLPGNYKCRRWIVTKTSATTDHFFRRIFGNISIKFYIIRFSLYELCIYIYYIHRAFVTWD